MKNQAILNSDGLARRPSDSLAGVAGVDPSVVDDVRTLEGLVESVHALGDVISEVFVRFSMTAEAAHIIADNPETPADVAESIASDETYSAMRNPVIIAKILTMFSRFVDAEEGVDGQTNGTESESDADPDIQNHSEPHWPFVVGKGGKA